MSCVCRALRGVGRSKHRHFPLASTLLAVIGAAILFGAVQPLRADVVAYREIFPNNTSDNYALTSEGWAVHGNADAVAITSKAGIANANGRPTDAEAVNSHPQATAEDKSYAWFNGLTGNNTAFLWTEEIDDYVAIQTDRILTVSWYQGNTLSNARVRAALEVDGQWYASVDRFTNSSLSSGSDFSTKAELKTVDVSAALWYPLSFTAGSVLSLNATTTKSLPSGMVTGGGLYFENTSYTNSQRVDTFTITVVPEPSALVLLLCGGLAWVAWRSVVRARSSAANR